MPHISIKLKPAEYAAVTRRATDAELNITQFIRRELGLGVQKVKRHPISIDKRKSVQ